MSSGKMSVSDRDCRNSCVCCQEMAPLPRRSCAVTVSSVLPSRSLMTVRWPSVDRTHVVCYCCKICGCALLYKYMHMREGKYIIVYVRRCGRLSSMTQHTESSMIRVCWMDEIMRRIEKVIEKWSSTRKYITLT